MKCRSTWILVGIFAALGAYVTFVEGPRQRAGEKAKEGEGLLFPDLQIDRVTEIRVSGGKGTATLKKAARGWSLVEPLTDAADEGRVESLLSDLKGLKAEREVGPAQGDLGRFGLSNPDRVVTTRGAETSLQIGAENPAGEARYVRAGAGPVQVVRNEALAGLLADPGEWRSRDVVGAFPWARLRSVEVRDAAGQALKLVKEAQRWRLEEPIRSEADPEAASALVEKLRWAKIDSFVGVEPPQARDVLARGVRVVLDAEGEASPTTLRLTKAEGGVWGERSGRNAVFRVGEEVLSALEKGPEELRRRKPVLVRAWSAERLELSAPGKTAAYAKAEGEQWRSGGKALPQAEAKAVQAFLDHLEATRASAVIDAPEADAAYGLAPPAVAVKVKDADRGEQTFELGTKGGKTFARAGKTGPVYVVDTEYLTKALELVGRKG